MTNIDRLREMSIKDTDDCVEWDRSFYNSGYGVLRKGYKMVNAHREAFFMFNGYYPQVVRHTCDNRKCVNVRHLLGGTTKDNINDKIERKRHVFGENVKNSKLTKEEVLQIRNIGRTMFQKDIAKQFNCSQTLVGQILNRKIWKHI